jgi:hypothetical protein
VNIFIDTVVALHVAEDPSQTRNFAAEHRDRLISMIATWYVEAGQDQVMRIAAADSPA